MNAEAWSRQRTALALIVAVMVLALAAIFDREWRDGEVFSPADLVFQFQPWASDVPRQSGTNATRSDEAFYHQPLMATHFARLREGALPDYDPTRLAGVPSFFQGLDTGRLLSPFSLPFYLLPSEDAVSVYGPLRLLVAALCMWALLRGLGMSAAAAACGGVAYGLNGHFLLWLSAPMPTVAAWLPLGVLYVRRTAREPSLRHAALLAIAVGLMATGGYLATFMACLLALGFYAAVELGVARRWHAALWLGGGVVAGLLLGAGALGPMIGSLLTSPAHARVVSADGAVWANVATLALPDFWGTPLQSNWWHPDPTANYPEHVAYLGIAVTMLAGVGLASLRLRRHPLGWSAAALLVVSLTRAYGVWPGTWLLVIPGQAQSNPFRWYVIAALAMAVLAAYGIQALQGTHTPGAPPTTRRRWHLIAGACLALVLLATGVGAALYAWLPEIRTRNLQAFEKAQLVRFASVAAVTLALIVVAARARTTRLRGLATILLVVVAAGDLAQANRRFNPTVPRERYYPATRGLAWLADEAMGARVAPVDAHAELVEGHVWSMFGIQTVTGFDFHGDALYQHVLHAAQHPRTGGGATPPDAPPTVWDFVGLQTTTLDLKLLGVLGTRFIVTSPVDVMPRGGGYDTLGELLPGRVVTFRFRPRFDGLRRVDVLTATYARANTGQLRITLSNEAGIVLASRSVPASAVPDNDWLPLTFPPAFPSAGATFVLRIEAEGSRPGAAPTVWTTLQDRADTSMDATLDVDGQPVPRTLWVRAFSSAPDRVPGASLAYAGDLNAYRNPYARPPAWFVDRVRTASPDTHVSRMQTAEFDPARDAWLTLSPAVPPTGSARVTSIDVSDDTRRYAVEAPDGGVLVIGERAHSGWKAEVDGAPVTWQPANGVLMAVAVSPGSRVVRLTFEQPLLRPSLGVTCLALVGIVFALVVSGRRR
jgi:hypothetical protein